MNFTGAWFDAASRFGVAARLAADRFRLAGDAPGIGAVDLSVGGLEAGVAAAARFPHLLGPLTFEGQLGYGYLDVPTAFLASTAARTGGPGLSAVSVQAHGPTLLASLELPVTSAVGLEASVRALPVGFGARYADEAMSLHRFAVGARMVVGGIDVSDVQLAGFLGYELASTTGSGARTELRQIGHQVGLGLRATLAQARPARIIAAAAPVRARIAGRVRLAGRGDVAPDPLAGVVVEGDHGARTRTGADGRFTLEDVPAGLVTLHFSGDGLAAREEVVAVPKTGEVGLDVLVRRATALSPTVVIGLVRSDLGGPVMARVSIVDLGIEARADERGHFRLSVPPGRYEISVEADGYLSQQKRLEARPGQQSIFNIDLHRTP